VGGAVLKPGAHADRRQAARRAPRDREPLGRIRLRTGREVKVLDVSDHGVLAEGSARLLPGTHVDAHLVTATGRVLVRSRVVRAWITALEQDGPLYRCALAFQQRVDTSDPGYVIPGPASGTGAPEGSVYPATSARALPIEAARLPA
jgi:hypothetical protein